MGITVAAHFMSGGGDAADQARMMVGHPSQDEKSPTDISAGQHFEHPFCLRFDAGGKGTPVLRAGRTLHLGGVEIFLHIDTQNVAHLPPSRRVCAGSTLRPRGRTRRRMPAKRAYPPPFAVTKSILRRDLCTRPAKNLPSQRVTRTAPSARGMGTFLSAAETPNTSSKTMGCEPACACAWTPKWSTATTP